jgi:diguanylate cyclase (GGDEF)-like protein
MNGALIVLMERLDRIPKVAHLVGAVVMVGLVVLVDLASGPDVVLAAVYAVAVIAATWAIGWRAGVAIAVVAAVAGFVVGVAERDEAWPVLIVNHALRLVSFVVVAALVVAARSSVSKLVVSARVDPMTGALNKQGFLDELARVRQRAMRGGEPVAVVYFDLDGLKIVNDRDGHAAGDALIRRFADRVGRHLRASDPFGRLGGDEFAVVLERADADTIDIVVGRILDDPGLPSASCGVQVFQGSYPSPAAMIAGADRRMYEEKRGRRIARRPP